MSIESDLQVQRTILLDLSRHLEHRIDTALGDFRERCEEVDLDFEPTMTLALTVLGHFFACGAHASGADEAQFLQLCRTHYRMGSESNRKRANAKRG
jgi:hypothetical protein